MTQNSVFFDIVNHIMPSLHILIHSGCLRGSILKQ